MLYIYIQIVLDEFSLTFLFLIHLKMTIYINYPKYMKYYDRLCDC